MASSQAETSVSSSWALQDIMESVEFVNLEGITRYKFTALVVLSTIVYAGGLTITYLAAMGQSVLFPNSTSFVTGHFLIEITPSNAAYAVMWSISHAWTIAWLVYVITIAYRSCTYGYLCVIPGHIAPFMFPCFIISSIFDSLWLIVRNHFLIGPGLVLLALSTASSLAASIVAHKQLDRTGLQLLTMKSGSEIWWTRIVLLNGLSLHTTWTAVLAVINTSIIMTYIYQVPQSLSTTYGLCALALLTTLWAVSDIYYLDRYSRYTLTPYLALIITFSGILARNDHLWNNNTVLNVIMLGSLCILFTLRIISLGFRHRKKPIFNDVSAFRKSSTRNYGTNEFMQISVS